MGKERFGHRGDEILADSEDESSDSAWARGRSGSVHSALSLPASDAGESTADIPQFTPETAAISARSVHESILRHGQVSTKLPWDQGVFAFPQQDIAATGIARHAWSQPLHIRIVLPLPLLQEKLTAGHCVLLGVLLFFPGGGFSENWTLQQQ